MANGKLMFVVWEWENKQGRWRPYTPEISQLLERAYNKSLSSVMLKDADQALANYSINLPTMMQICKNTNESTPVRREFYPQPSPAGQGAVWQWGGDTAGDWHIYDMNVQCVIEDSWGSGARTVDMSTHFAMCPYLIDFINLNQKNTRTGCLRIIRRIKQAAYPVGRPPAPAHPPLGIQTSQNQHSNLGLVAYPGPSTRDVGYPVRGCSDGVHESDKSSRRRGTRGGGVGAEDNQPRGNRNESSVVSRKFIEKVKSLASSSCTGGGNGSNTSNYAYTSTSSKDSSPQPLPRSSFPPTPLPRTVMAPCTQPVPQSQPIPHSQSTVMTQIQTMQPHSHMNQPVTLPHSLPHHYNHSTSPANQSVPCQCRNFGDGTIHKHPNKDAHIHQDQYYRANRQSVPSFNNSGSPEPNQQFDSHEHHCENASYNLRSIDRNTSRCESMNTHFGSNMTIDSDCGSSLASGRRPSVDTISTYLSQDSTMDDDSGSSSHNSQYGNNRTGPVVGQLVNIDDDDVFEDTEVRDVMMRDFRKTQVEEMQTDSSHFNGDGAHFRPINNPAGEHSDSSNTFNGVKQKRIKSKPAPHSSSSSSSSSSSHNYPSNNTRSNNNLQSQSSYRYSDRGANNDDNNNTNGSRYNSNSKDNGRYRKVIKQLVNRRPPQTPLEKVLHRHTQVVQNPSTDECPICMCGLVEDSGYEGNDTGEVGLVVSLLLCKHEFHEECLKQMLKATFGDSIQCPNCKVFHGDKIGTQPIGGKMHTQMIHRTLPGFNRCNTLQITYSFPSGIQGPEHPHPGRPYNLTGFPRVAFLPDNKQGKKILCLLRLAWDRRLLFTVGKSVTTGIDDTVTWNEIHHKTEWQNYNGHGYPDPNYLDNVTAELAAQGVVEATITSV